MTAPSLPVVDDGSSESEVELHYGARTVPLDGPRVYAKTRNVWIRPKPTTREPWIGFLWFGGSVKLKDPTPIPGWGCNTGWYAIEPRGYVCVDGKRSTLDPNDPLVQALAPLGPDSTLPDPHPHYGESIDAVRYSTLPDETTMRKREPEFARMQGPKTPASDLVVQERQARELAHELAALSNDPETPIWLVPGLPENLRDRHPHLVKGSAVAWTRELQHAGRTLLLTDDLSWVPKDRVRPLPPVEFQGIHLGADVQLPIAFFRDDQRHEYRRTPDGHFEITQTTHALHSWVKLTGERAYEGKTTYVELGNGNWLDKDDAVIPEPRELTPWGAPVFGVDATGRTPPGRATWVQVSIRGGWLVAYEGTQPVFATLISAGRGGPPHGSKPTGSTASTPTGWYNITGKFTTATMIAPDRLVHSAVAWAQNFVGPYSLHSAYWHNGWGYGKSGGCVNLSPKDSYFLFHFTEPVLPEGWHGVRWEPELEPSTGVVIEKGPWRPLEPAVKSE